MFKFEHKVLNSYTSIISVDNSGNRTELVVKAGGVRRARCYEMRFAVVDAAGVPGPWLSKGFFSNSRSMAVDGLTPGANYAFRVRAMVTAGLTEWSDPIAHLC